MPTLRFIFDLLDRMDCGAVLIDVDRQVEGYNALAEQILLGPHNTSNNKLSDIRNVVKSIIQADSKRLMLDTDSWIIAPRSKQRPLAFHAMPAGEPDDPYFKTILIIIDLEHAKEINPKILQDMFGLTPSEAALSIRLSQGKTPLEIAKEKNVSPWTVRTQLASVFLKTNSRRQSDVVALVHKISILT